MIPGLVKALLLTGGVGLAQAITLPPNFPPYYPPTVPPYTDPGFTNAPTAGVNILQQPAAGTLFVGETATMSVSAEASSGSSALNYQWRLDEVPLEGQTNATLSITNFAAANIGSYSVRVSNSNSFAFSRTVHWSLASRAAGQLIDINFTAHLNPTFSVKTGPAAIGVTAADIWNVYSRDVSNLFDWRDSGTVTNLVWTDGSTSGANVAVTNAAGAWYTFCADPMLQSYLYPLSRSGPITATLSSLPPQRYDIYVYAHGQPAEENAVVDLNVNGATVATATTSDLSSWDSAAWIEGNQYVVFRGVEAPAGTELTIVSHGGTSGLAVLNGIQLAPAPSLLSIVTQPISQTNALGSTLTLSVQAAGSATFAYQWYKDGSPLPRATNSTYTVDPVVASTAGSYVAVARNFSTSIASQAATVTVLIGGGGGATMARLLNLDYGDNNDFGRKVGKAAAGLTDADFWNVYSRDIHGLLNTPNGMKWSDGTLAGVQVAASNEAGAWGTGSTDPMLHTYLYPGGHLGDIPSTFTSFPGGTYDIYVYAHGVPGVENAAIELKVGSALIGTQKTTTQTIWDTPGWTEGNEYVRFANVAVPDNGTLTITAKGDASPYGVINGIQFFSSPVAVVAPELVSSSASVTVFEGETASFAVNAQGLGLSYQWLKDGAPLSGQNSAALTIANADAANVGKYSVRVSNSVGAVVSASATLSLAQRAASALIAVDFTAHLNPSFSVKTGPAAVGVGMTDVWNVYSRDLSTMYEWRADGVITNLNWTDGSASGASLTVSNAAGAWPTLVSDAMMQSYLYPLSRQGDIQARFANLPARRYNIYVYAHGQTPSENAVINLKVGGALVESRATSFAEGWDTSAWIAGNQYVVFSGIQVPADVDVEIVSAPGQASLAVINGIQLAPQPETLQITQQPVAQTVTVGSPFTLSVTAHGSAALSYQWLKDGQEITNATASNFHVAAASTSDRGAYSVRIRSGDLSVASAVAQVTVTFPFGNLINIDYGPTSEYGHKVGPAATGISPNDHWNMYSCYLPGLVNAPNGLRWSDGSVAGGQIEVANGDGYWGTGSDDPMLHTYLYPGSHSGNVVSTFTNLPPGNYDIYVYAHGAIPSENGVVEITVNGVSFGTKTTTTGDDWDSSGWTEGHEYVVFSNVQVVAADSLQIICKPGANGTAVINGVQFLAGPSTPSAPLIVNQPVGATRYAGQSATLSASVIGTRPITYQWRHAGTNVVGSDRISGANTTTLTLAGLTLEDAGAYSLIASNSVGQATSETAQVDVVADTAAPVITITSPIAGAQTNAVYALTGTIFDGNTIASATWELNGVSKGSIPLVGGAFSVGGLRFDPGTTTIKVTAADAAGNESSATVAVTWVVPRALFITQIAPVQEGTRFSVPISLVSTGGIGGLTFTVAFDTNTLAEAQFEWSPELSLAFVSANLETPKQYRATFALPGTALPAGSNTIAMLSFRARSVPTTANSIIRLELQNAYDQTGTPFPGASVASSATVSITRRQIIGDINANNRLDVGDASLMLRMVSRIDPIRSWDRSLNDLNKNLDLDSGDAIRVLRAVVGLDPQPTGTNSAKAFIARDGGPVPGIDLVADKSTAVAGDKVTVEVRLVNQTKMVQGTSFRLEYPVEALRLDNASAHVLGNIVPSGAAAIWNVAPSQNNYLTQSGVISLGIAHTNVWAANNGVLARLTFTVQPGAATRYSWPVQIKNVEVARNGFETEAIGSDLFDFHGRQAVGADFSAAIVLAPAQAPKITFAGEIGATYVVEASSNLIDWSVVGSFECVDGTVHVEDAAGVGAEARYYRATVAP